MTSSCHRHVVVLGGGITGLTSAVGLRRLPILDSSPRVTLLEASPTCGGWLQSHTLSSERHSFLFEKGCRSIRPRGANQRPLLKLIELLELDYNDILPSSPAASQRRYIYYNGHLNKVPETPVELMKWSLIRGKLRSFVREATARGPQFNSEEEEDLYDESVDSFFRRRLGDDIADRMVDPMISGVYAGDSAQLSIKSVFPSLYHMEREYGSLMKAMLFGKSQSFSDTANGAEEMLQIQDKKIEELTNHGSISFRHGVSQLANRAVELLSTDENVAVETSTECTSIQQTNQDTITLNVKRKGASKHEPPESYTIEADDVISCIPAQSLSKLLPESLASSKESLSNIASSSVASVNIGWEPAQGDVLQGKRGFGYLVPTSQWETGGAEDIPESPNPSDVIPGVLGMTWDSCVFPSQGNEGAPDAEYIPEKHGTRVTAMIGGSRFSDVEHMSEDEIELLAILATREHMNIEIDPDVLQANIARHAIPQYNLGHQRRLRSIREEVEVKLPRLYLAGNSYDGVGVADCVNSAFGALTRMLKE
eukprot:gb/GECG01000089.1/.p1 GENE.gb/GECG01000089.1/~~gb/GECG01000089.1/.p1  ORF type:complete len:538 (+),score=70.45 gb/GECG01000089.1/:1-1614(+)